MLVCATETKLDQDIDAYARAMKDAMQYRAASAAPLEETS
jgi:hypothetical protein